jgi:Spy/CpxP family protein refolding chaperone
MRALTVALAAAALAAAALVVTPAVAQVERLPEQSRAERQSQDINRSIVRQQQILRENQQTQFEINQLRGEVQRNYQFPSMTGPGAGGGCAPGSIGC